MGTPFPPSWLLGLILGSIIPAGLAQVPESLVGGVYLGLELDALAVPGAKGRWVYFRNNKE